MTELSNNLNSTNVSKGLRGSQVIWIVLATVLLTVMVTFWFVRSYIYARDFTPVELQQDEQQTLDHKLQLLGYQPAGHDSNAQPLPANQADEKWLRPEAYTEANADRQVRFSERELNAMIANNKDLARKLAVDLSDDLVSARILVLTDPDFPIIGGKTLRVSTGIEMAFADGRPRVILKGVSLMGVPIPGSWLGGFKNIDLISEFGDAGGFWSGFADGVEYVEVQDGELLVKLKP